MKTNSDLVRVRRFYAETLRTAAHLRSDALVEAFATVPREAFVGGGPWRILTSADLGPIAYRTTPDADPRHLYRNVLVAIDADRLLNNGQPSSLAGWFDALDLKSGESVVHVGCGTGYYTAILAEVVGPRGRVVGIEIDVQLARRARDNLSYLKQVEVREGDGSALDRGAADAIFVNAGATHPRLNWINALRPGGRLLLPITASENTTGIGWGAMFMIANCDGFFEAHFVCRSPSSRVSELEILLLISTSQARGSPTGARSDHSVAIRMKQTTRVGFMFKRVAYPACHWSGRAGDRLITAGGCVRPAAQRPVVS